MTAPGGSPPQSTLHSLAAYLVRALRPLTVSFRDPAAFATLMFQLGWEVEDLPPEYTAIADSVDGAITAVRALVADPSPQDVLAVIDKVGEVYHAVTGLTVAPPGTDATAFLAEVPRRLFELLLAKDLLAYEPRWYNTLYSLGIIRFENTAAVPGRRAYMRWIFDWDQVPAILSDPASIPARLYGWGTADFAFGEVAKVLAPMMRAVGIPVSLQRIGSTLSAALQAGATAPPAGDVRDAITLPIFDFTGADGYHEVGFMLAGLPAEGTAPPGMILRIMAPSGVPATVDLGDGWTFAVREGTDLGQELAVVIRPGDTSIRYPFAPGQALPSAGLGLSLGYKAAAPTVLFGEPGKTRLELASGTLAIGVAEKAGEAEVTAGASVDGLTFVLHTADLNSFLAGILGDDAKVPIQLGLAWSSRTGLDFTAGAGLMISIYPHIDLGVLRFDRIDLGVKLVVSPAPEMAVVALLSLSGTIGPVSYAIEGLGVQLDAPLSGGNAGPAGLNLDAVLPTGIGLGIDADPVRGGGFISYDHDRGRYVGLLSLEVFQVGITAVAVLDTKDAAGADLPSPGYSLVLIIAADLPPIELGWGFTLNAVGGVAAINRRLDQAAMLAGVRAGTLGHILFPADPVRDANTIVAGIGTIFPIAMGRYVFGPTAIIGWGTPTLVTIEVAIIVELPSPVVVTLLGAATVVLPSADQPTVVLHVDVVGVWDSGQRTIAVDAGLHDSHVGPFTVAGDLALRVRYGDQAAFALAIGGLNPHFTPPPGFPTLRPVTVALGADDNPRISLEAYLALTSNSVQLGAKAELYAAAGGFNVHGWLGFDALVTLHPFGFRFDFTAGMTLNHGTSRIAGISVTGTLTGPHPFHAWGEGSLSLLFFDISVPFDATFGSAETDVELPPADPWAPLLAALQLLDNWAGEPAARHSVSFATPGTTGSFLDPAAAATVRQKVLPLGRPLEKFGQYSITGPDEFTISSVTLGTAPTIVTAAFTTVTDAFAPGDFEKLSDTDALSRDSFEDMAAGVRVTTPIAANLGAVKVAEVVYQTKIQDSSWRARPVPGRPFTRAQQLAAVRGGAVAMNGRSRFARTDARAAAVALDPEAYTVATSDTLAGHPEIATGVTKGAALAALRRSGATNLQVVPVHEVAVDEVEQSG